MCLFNDGKRYPLENNLRSMSLMDCCYAISVFDCCREKVHGQENRGIEDIEEDEDIQAAFAQCNNAKENFIVTFGCKPSRLVPKKSTLAANYLTYLQNMGRINVQQVGRMFFILPTALTSFQNSDGQCEHAIKTANPIAIEFVEDGSAQAEGEIDYFAYPGDREEESKE